MLIDVIREHSNFAIYGAQVVAYGAYTALRALYNRTPECFVVSASEDNPAKIEDIEVRTLDTCGLDAENTLVLIAVTELFQDEIAATLRSRGYVHTFRLTQHEEHLLMSAYYANIGRFPLAQKSPNCGSGGNGVFSLYEVRHHFDKPLRNHPGLEPWEVPIQAGAEPAGIRICEQLDNDGDNISNKNKQYCEASAMYKVWKSASTAWVGIEHYRRHLLVTPDMLSNDIDVILPLPYICYPNTTAQFRRFVGEEIVNALHKSLKELYRDEYETYARCLNGKYHCAYNLIVARKEVFGKFCEWAFNTTNHIETFALQSVAETRALAYVMEQLTSIYFIANRDKLTIVHAEKAIYT
jgi:hypothetical protein